MATDIFVDADTGLDGNSGADWANAKEHIQAAVDLITGAVSDETTIHLKSGTTASYTGDVDIVGINRQGKDGGFVIQPEVWNDSNYSSMKGDPFNATPDTGTWDVRADDKPCELELEIKIDNSEVTILGMQIKGKVEVSNKGQVKLKYCQVEGEDSMVFANGMGGAVLENCYLRDLPIGAVAYAKSSIFLAGQNYIENPFVHGIWALIDSTVIVAPWDDNPSDCYTTEIKTTSPRQAEFAAIKLVAKSYLYIKDGDINPWDVSVANIRVVHDLDTLPATYYGAVLESASTLQGASLMSFVTKNKKGDYVDMPAGQQIVGNDKSIGTTVI